MFEDDEFARQLGIMKDRMRYIRKSAVQCVDGHEFVTGSTFKAICKVFYDMDWFRDADGSLTLTMSLKEEFREADEDEEDMQRSFNATVPYSEVSGFSLNSAAEERLMVYLALDEFEEKPILEGMYITITKQL